MKNNIRIYRVKSKYIKYLSMYQEHIFAQDAEKDNRKYIGVVFEIKGMKYFAPLSSFKDKHKKMKESIDFIKIKDYAVINLNNMIPVPDSQIVDIDINKEKEPSYRYLLQAESREISRQKNRIRKNAEIVYSHKKHNDNSTALAKRTNNFELLEKLCKEYWVIYFPWEKGYLTPEIATPLCECSSGCYQFKVGECYLFSVKLDFDKAKEYRKSYGEYLRHNQWNDIEVEVCMLI